MTISSSHFKFISIILSTSIFALTACGGSSSDSNDDGNPINQMGRVTISGTLQLGEILTATISDGNGTNGSVISYQWIRNGEPIPSATSSTWTAVQSDVGFPLNVTATYTDEDGFGENITSAQTANIADISATDSSGSVSIVGVAQVGQELTAVITDGNGVSASNVTYEWRRDGTPIGGAAANSYTLVAADEGSAITLNVTYIDDDGFSGDVTSSPTASVTGSTDISCDATLMLPVNSVIADYEDDFYTASKSMDTSLSQESRWHSTELEQSIQFELLHRSLIKNISIAWYLGTQRQALFSVEISDDAVNWQSIINNVNSSGLTNDMESFIFDPTSALHIKIISHGNNSNSENGVVEVGINGCNNEPDTDDSLDELSSKINVPELTDYSRLNLDPLLPPSENFDLQDWYLSIPTDDDGSETADSIFEEELNNGYENMAFFYTGDDGGLVFKSPTTGFKTSTNTSYVRVELREMLRRGDKQYSTQGVNKNNWVFGSASENARNAAGGVDGRLFATLAVNQVTNTGLNYQIGRIIIGQIHANDDEPVRLYYRKLPNNSHGAIYIAHEVKGGDDRYYEMIGSRANETANPEDGIRLDEKFSYEIEATGNILVVSIHRPGKDSVVQTVDMRESGYDSDDQYQYFKAGVYHLNNSADQGEYAQATFYEINNSHDKYAH